MSQDSVPVAHGLSVATQAGNRVANAGTAADQLRAARSLSDEEQWVWRAFLATHRRLMEALERQLQASADMGVQDYLILAMLAEAPEQRLRMSELAFMSHGSSSRTSHAVDRLESRRWVQRVRSSEDGRGSVAVLTSIGVEQVKRATPVHVEVTRSYLFDLVSPEELAVLGRVMFAAMSAFDSPTVGV